MWERIDEIEVKSKGTQYFKLAHQLATDIVSALQQDHTQHLFEAGNIASSRRSMVSVYKYPDLQDYFTGTQLSYGGLLACAALMTLSKVQFHSDWKIHAAFIFQKT